jgi:hypothetical protein
MADTSVKIFQSSMAGAPTLNMAAGSLIAILDACLVNGFGLVTPESIVIANGIGVAHINAGHSAIPYSVVEIAGANESVLNAKFKVTSITTTRITFDATGISDIVASGTFSLKLAGAGWRKAFEGLNTAAYQSANVQASGSYLRVDDNATTYAAVLGYEVMYDIDSGMNRFPLSSQYAALYINKANAAGNWGWWIIANDRFAYVATAGYAGYPQFYFIDAFGDIVSRKSVDPYRFAIFAKSVAGVFNFYQGSGVVAPSGGNNARYIARPYHTLAYSQPVAITAFGAGSGFSGYGGSLFPNPADNGVLMAPIHIAEGSGYRGDLPGIFWAPQNLANSLPGDTLITNVDGLGRDVIFKTFGGVHPSYYGSTFFDLTGPWAS